MRQILASFFPRIAVSILVLAAASLARSETVEILYNFTGDQDGSSPRFGVTFGDDGDLYGVTNSDGEHGYGTAFRIATNGANYTVLHAFDWGYMKMSNPYSPLTKGSDGNFYGTTGFYSGAGEGHVYKLTPSGQMTTLYSFDGDDGDDPRGGLFEGVGGTLYGSTRDGGSPYSAGTLFSISKGGAMTVLTEFTGSDGSSATPSGRVIQLSGGALIAPCLQGGEDRCGTLVRYHEGKFSTIHAFTGAPDGGQDAQDVILGGDGMIYGTTIRGGLPQQHGTHGIIYRIGALGNDFEVLHRFNGPNGWGPDPLYQDSTDGHIYGCTGLGGENNAGTIYRLTADGEHTVLYSFPGGAGGSGPRGRLAKGTDGALYAATSSGGTYDKGTIFRFIPGPTQPPAVDIGLDLELDADRLALSWEGDPEKTYIIQWSQDGKEWVSIETVPGEDGRQGRDLGGVGDFASRHGLVRVKVTNN